MQAPLAQIPLPFFRFKLALPLSFSSAASCQSSSVSNGRFIQDHPIFLLLYQARHLADFRILHAHVTTSGLIHDTFAASRVVQSCLRLGTAYILYASAIFDSLPCPDVFTWNAIIAGHTELGSPESSVALYFRMRASPLPPNLYTFALLVKACREHGDCRNSMHMGKKVHGQVKKSGVEDFIVVKNSILGMYCNMGLLDDAHLLFNLSPVLDLISWNILISAHGKSGGARTARSLFDAMPRRNLVSWSALIDGYVRSGDCLEALKLFNGMQCEGMRPDIVTLVSVLKACAHSGALDQGRWTHLYIERNKLGSSDNVILCTALVDMYCRCGCIDAAFKVFDGFSNGDIVLWNAMIGGLAMHGHGCHALELFCKMKEKGMVPNEATYIGVLCACAHAGMVDEGIEIFDFMKANDVEPQREHYGCLADLLGRAGRIHKAEEVMLNMPMEPQAAQWGALMSACRMHKDFDVGVRAGKHLIELEPNDAGRYVLLANMYADAGLWEEAMAVRREMEEKGGRKETGCSLIEWNGTVHEFVAGAWSHPQSKKIYEMLEQMERRLEMVGYVKDTSQMLVDMDGEEKAVALSYHSEKIAMAFGILNIGQALPIRISKNLRVCKDCHNYTKLVSKVYQREIIVRDRNRFHHFRKGFCSCRDYW